MWKVTVQVLGGEVRHVEMDVGEDGVTVEELRELLEKRLGPMWRYCGLLVDGSNADYLSRPIAGSLISPGGQPRCAFSVV